MSLELNKLSRLVKANDLRGITRWVDDVVSHAKTEARTDAFVEAVDECQAYSKSTSSMEAKSVAMNLAVRITQRAKKK